MLANAWKILGSFGDSLGPSVNVITALAWLWGLFSLGRGIVSRLRRRKLIRRKTPCDAVAIAIGIGGKVSPVPPAREYIRRNCPGVPLLIEYSRTGILSPDQIVEAVEDVRDALGQLMSSGRYISEALLFYGGPNTVALSVGALFANWVPVQVFQFEDGRYVYQYTLDRRLLKDVSAKCKDA